MSEETETPQELEVGVGDKKLKLRGSDLLTSVIGMIVCSGLVLLWFVLTDHKTDTREVSAIMVSAIKEMTQAQRESTKEQRVMNCLLATRQDERRGALQDCERIAR